MPEFSPAYPELSPAYSELRDTMLAVAPHPGSMDPTEELPHVYGVLIDIGFEVLYTVSAFSDGTTRVYDSKGGAITGLGGMEDMAVVSHALLRAVEASLDAFKPVESTPLPGFQRIRFTVLTHGGRLGVEVDGPPLLKGPHPLSKPFAAAMAIMERARQVSTQPD